MKESVHNTLPKDNWPERLLEIPQPPEKLYIRGTMPKWDEGKFLCVVGARKYSTYGKEVCEMLIESLRGKNVTIVSGLALGIDGIAHRTALSAGLKTVAVPGSGLDPKVLYPASHARLAEEIVNAGGALLSEFEPNFRATVWSFPQRNRIMAGLSHAVLIIEAEKKSGTLITARLATEYNRDVLTIPGNIFSKNSEGPHLLIRLGATPITTGGELSQALGFKEETQTKLALDYSDCSPEEKLVIDILIEPKPRDQVIRELAKPIGEANTILSIMEIKGLITESMGELHLA